MHLERLQVAELRQFRAPFELTGLHAGLNIFTGDNEAGKSTLVRALRAAFLERHRSTAVEDLRPYGDSTASPSIQLDFRIAGTPYRLKKSFLHKKYCELVVGTRQLEGVEAENHLAEILGFQFAAKGVSRQEHWGIPGLLWIEQGSGQVVREAVGHAVDHLRSALDQSLGEVATSGTDELLAKVRSLRDELLTATGKPRSGSAYLQAIESAADSTHRVAELQSAVQTYRDQVDQLAQLRTHHMAHAQEQPWTRLREAQAEAQAALQATQALAGACEEEREKLRHTASVKELLLQQLQAAEQQTRTLATREAQVLQTAAQKNTCAASEEHSAQADVQAAAQLEDAQRALTLARQEDSRALLLHQLTDTQRRQAELTSLLARVTAQHQEAADLKRQAAHLRLEPADLKQLRQQDQRLRELAISQSAIATRLRFNLQDSASVLLGKDTVTGVQEHLLLSPTMLTIAGVGTVHIAPGGNDLAALTQEHAALQGDHTALLQRLGLASLAEAEERHTAFAQQMAQSAAAERTLAALAPQGVQALERELDAAQARCQEANAAIARLPTSHAADVPTLSSATQRHATLREVAEAARTRLQQARQDLATATSQHEAAQQERDALKASLDNPQRQQQLTEQSQRLIEASAQHHALERAVAALEANMAAAQPEILKQDVERLRRSADALERTHHERATQIALLEASLSAAGAQGLEEELARQQSALTLATRRRDELQRRAQALCYLQERLEARRQALTRRLQAPLQKHLDHYLRLIFPKGQLAVDDALVPGTLSRTHAQGSESSDFETLSFGAREQMGVISRLAYADLLQQAGRPTLLILDDALVHSDAQRLAHMKRVLFDAAQRHQMLLFTCHPAQWQDMGVPLRALHKAS